MKRKVWFRAWDKQRKEWGYFTLSELVQGQASLIWSHFENWCEYTGLEDKNGKRIYEGDIVRSFVDGEKCDDFPVEWEVENAGGDLFSGFVFSPDHDEFEIIGNIYENSELL